MVYDSSFFRSFKFATSSEKEEKNSLYGTLASEIDVSSPCICDIPGQGEVMHKIRQVERGHYHCDIHKIILICTED